MKKLNEIFSNDNYLKNILRSISVCLTGFILTFILYMIFYGQAHQSDLLASLFVFIIFTVLLFYSIVVENILFFLLKKNLFKSFLITYSILFVLMLFSVSYLDEKTFLSGIILCLVFFILQIVGFLYQHKTKYIKKGKDWTV